MDVLDNTFKAVNAYFKTLAHLGYKKQSTVDKLLIYIFIEEILTGEMQFFVTEDDYRLLNQALYCLYGTDCLIPYPHYKSTSNLFGYFDNTSIALRLTQDNNIRSTQDGRVRVKA